MCAECVWSCQMGSGFAGHPITFLDGGLTNLILSHMLWQGFAEQGYFVGANNDYDGEYIRHFTGASMDSVEIAASCSCPRRGAVSRSSMAGIPARVVRSWSEQPFSWFPRRPEILLSMSRPSYLRTFTHEKHIFHQMLLRGLICGMWASKIQVLPTDVRASGHKL